jgi:deoxyribose-phosphate aldolase
MSVALDEILSLADEYEHALPPAPQLFPAPTGPNLASWIDHTLLKPEATADQVKKLCSQAREFHFATVCINPSYVPLAAGLLSGSGVGVCTVAAFPLGASLPELKAHEASGLVEKGANEIDMVINIGALKNGDVPLALDDVQAVVNAAAGKAKIKVILEMTLLTLREKILGCLLSKAAGADFVKTSTGFQPGGATVEDVALMRRVVGAGMGVKAAGGIRSLKDAQAMIAAGANRLGSSAGVSILEQVLQGATA